MNLIYLATEDVTRGQVSGKVHFWAVTRELIRSGNDVVVVAPRFTRSSPTQAAEANAKLYTLFAWGKSPIGILVFEAILAAHIWRLKRQFRPDAVLVRGGGPGWFMGVIFLLFRSAGIPVILECNGIVWRELAYRKKSWLYIVNAYFSAWQQALTCNRIIGVSTGITEAYRRLGWRREEHCQTIPNGTDPSQFEFSTAERQRARELLNIHGDAIVAGYVGMFSPWHDIQSMVGAAEILQSQGHNEVLIVLIGKGPLLDWACRQKEEKKLNLLRMPGEISDRAILKQWLACFDIGLCVYSDLEGSPLKMFEYMATGIPIVGSGFPQILEICQAQNVGIGLSPSSPESVASAIVRIKDAADEWKKVGCHNRKLAINQYNWQRVATNVEDAIRRCLT